MANAKRDLIIFQKKGRPEIIRMIKNKIIIVVSSKTTKTIITKTTSLLTLR